MKSRAPLFSLLTLSCFLGVFWLSARAQQAPSQPDVQILSQILTEVRQLRAAVQRSSQIVYRGQLLLEQLRTQQEKVARLSGQLEELRAQQTQIRAPQPQMQERLRNLEADLNRESDSVRRTQLEAETKAMRQFFEGMGNDEQQMQERERQLMAQFLTEQTALNDLTTQLKDIEQSLVSGMEGNHTAKAQRSR